MSLPGEEEPSIGTLFARLADDGKAFARAQVDLYRHTALYRFGTVKWALVAGVVAVVLTGSAVTALLVGLILSLTPLVGPLGATAIVVVVALAIAGLLGKFAAGRFAALGDPVPGDVP